MPAYRTQLSAALAAAHASDAAAAQSAALTAVAQRKCFAAEHAAAHLRAELDEAVAQRDEMKWRVEAEDGDVEGGDANANAVGAEHELALSDLDKTAATLNSSSASRATLSASSASSSSSSSSSSSVSRRQHRRIRELERALHLAQQQCAHHSARADECRDTLRALPAQVPYESHRWDFNHTQASH